MNTEQKSKYIYDKILKDGYIMYREIVHIFNGRNITQAVTVIENCLDVQLYDELLKVLKSGKGEDSKSGDKYKYKYIKIFRSQTELFNEWREEVKQVNGQANGWVVTNERSLWRAAG